ncbi:MAG: hypothetical protein JHD02_10495 [Thermoleophilaceae bacterium]|nr:hypothetical protein [Thermoleophilaceae bacterium]
MNSFAHFPSHSLERKDASSLSSHFTLETAIAFLIAALIAVLISGALVYNSMTNEISSLQTAQVAAQQKNVQSNAFSACVENNPGVPIIKCREASSTFAAVDPQPAAFDKAVAFIYAP